MAAYQYKAVDKTGQPARGSLEAANEVDLELRLRRMGLDLITFREIEKTASGFGGGGSVSTMQNQNGVKIRMGGTSTGLRFKAGVDGLKVQLKE